jgi:hypothetical protein
MPLSILGFTVSPQQAASVATYALIALLALAAVWVLKRFFNIDIFAAFGGTTAE